MRCSACGATNPSTATWCGQCYRRFDEEPAAPATVPPPSANGDTPRPVAPTEGFRRRDDVVEWECPQCAHYNAIELQRCEVCGTAFVERFRQDTTPVEHNWPVAMALSAVAPGAGHLAIGRNGSGSARLLLFCGWLAGAVLLVTSGGASALVVATPLLLGALIVWALSLLDLYRLKSGESELLVGRQLLWLVVGVLVLLVVGLFGTVGTAAPGSAA